MMRPVNLSTQLTLMILAVSFCAVALLSVAFWGIDYSRAKGDARRHIEGMMRVIATSAEWPMVMKEKSLPQRLLDGLSADPEVRIAFLYDAEQKPYARYVRRDVIEGAGGYFTPERLAQAYASSSLSITFTESAIHGFLRLGTWDPVGVLYVESDLHRFHSDLLRYFAGLAGVVLLVCSLTLIFSNRVQQVLSRQVSSMASWVHRIIESQDFSLRFTKERADELGIMIDGMNRLLAHLEERDELLHDYRLKLEERVEERTRELDLNNRRLRQTNEELTTVRTDLDRLNRAKDRFLAVFSHEIRTPLTSILTSAELLRERLPEGESREIADTLFDAGQGLNDQIDHILNYTRIESGVVQLKQEVVDLRTLLEGLVFRWGDAASRKGLHLLADIPWNHSWKVVGDSTRLQQIFANLLNNSIKFTPQGGVVVSASQKEVTDGLVLIRVEVTDSGPGIPVEVDVFAPYVQSGEQKGTGLGLAIAHSLARCMGAGLTHSPGQNGGTTFCFEGEFPTENAGVVPLLSPQLPVYISLQDRQLMQIVSRRLLEVGANVVDTDMGGMDYGGAILIQDRLPEESVSRRFTHKVLIDVADKVVEGSDTLLLKHPVDWYRLQEFLARPDGHLVTGHDGGGTEGILLVEDNEATARLLRIILENRGYRVNHVDSGSRAVAEGSSHKYSLILLDIQIPDLDGFAVASALRQAGVAVPILAVSALPAESTEQRARGAGMNGYIQKPFNGVTLLEAVGRFLEPPTSS